MEQFAEFYQLTKPIEVVNPTSSVEKIYGPYPTIEEALSELSLLGLKGRQFTLVAENGEVDLYLYQENLEPKLVTKSYRVFDSDTDGLVPKSTTATASMYLNGVGQWSTPPNTTYSSGSLSTLNDTPTNTTNRIWSASILNQWLDSKNFITEYTDTTYATFTKDVGGLVPAPTGTTSTRYLREDGTWVIPTNTTYSSVTTAEYNTVIAGNATATTGRTITPKMLQDVIDNANFNKAKKLSTPVNINGIPFDGSEDITIPVGEDGEVYNVFNSTTNGLVPTPNETNATKFLRADGTWIVPTNTTYSLATQANIDTGTETTGRLWSVKLMVDNFAKKDHTHTEYIPTTHAANGITSTLISNWNIAYTNNHTHNQILNTNSAVKFTSVNDVRINGIYNQNREGMEKALFDVGTLKGIGTSIGGDGYPYYAIGLHWKANDRYASLSAHPFDPVVQISSGDNLWSRYLAFTDNPVSITATAFYTSSSIKYKTNIKPFNKECSKLIKDLELVTYDRTDDETQKGVIGVIAEDTNELFLSPEKDAVDIYKSYFILVKAFKELSEEVKQLKEQLNGR